METPLTGTATVHPAAVVVALAVGETPLTGTATVHRRGGRRDPHPLGNTPHGDSDSTPGRHSSCRSVIHETPLTGTATVHRTLKCLPGAPHWKHPSRGQRQYTFALQVAAGFRRGNTPHGDSDSTPTAVPISSTYSNVKHPSRGQRQYTPYLATSRPDTAETPLTGTATVHLFRRYPPLP